MNRQEIQQLLDMFLDGMTTVEQEQRLAEYFRSASDVPPEWEPFRRMFGWFDSGMTPPLFPPRGKNKRIFRFAPIVSAAACAAVLLGVFLNTPESLPTISTAEKETHSVKTEQSLTVATPKEEHAAVKSSQQRHKSESSSHPGNSMDSSRKALAEAERIYNEQDHDMVDERYEDVRQAVCTQEVRSRGFFTAVDEQGNVRIVQCTNENTNQSNLVEL